MAGENEIRGTKNLGLIQAIYSGINPPLNTKVIWYDNNVGQKIHKYYKIEISQWVPFGGDLSIIVNGHYVYIAYASNCDGADFNFEFDDTLHTHTSILSSPTQIGQEELVPELFENKWIKFCGDEVGGNFTYIGFADDCNGVNFGLEPMYEVDCKKCEYANGYQPITPLITPTLKYDIRLDEDSSGFNLILDGTTPKVIEIEAHIGGNKLIDGLEYCIEVQVPAEFNRKFYVRLDGSETGGYSIIPSALAQTIKFTKVNRGSRIYIEFYQAKTPLIGELHFKLGTSECCLEEPPKNCFKCRCCWAIITSPTPLEVGKLGAKDFEGKWVCGCGCSDGDSTINRDLENLKQLIYNLNEKQVSDNTSVLNTIAQLVKMNNDITEYINNQISNVNQSITNQANTFNGILDNITKDYQTVLTYIGLTDNSIAIINQQLSDAYFDNRVLNIVANYSNIISLYDKFRFTLDSVKLNLNWKNGDAKGLKSLNTNTVGIQDGVYNRNGYISANKIVVNEFGEVVYLNKAGNPTEEDIWYVKDISNLVVNIDDVSWEDIKRHKPFIQITRYKNSAKKGSENIIFTGGSPTNNWRHSGFKLNKENPVYRPNEISLKRKYQIIDFGQEHYFLINRMSGIAKQTPKRVVPRGLTKRFFSRFASPNNINSFVLKCWMYLEFQIGIELDGQIILSKPLQRLKMTLDIETLDDGVIYTEHVNSIKFKYV